MNNRFKSNSRFSVLAEEDENEIKQKINNDKKQNQNQNQNSDYSRTNNSFKQFSNNEYYRRTRPIYNPNNNSIKTILIPTYDIQKSINEFPGLNLSDSKKVYSKENTIEVDNKSFKTILNKIQPVSTIQKKYVKPGWVEISFINKKIEYIHGEKTSEQINREVKESLENNHHYCMSKAVDKMVKNHEKYKITYDILYGEGSYDQMYYSKPVYGSEYDTESDDGSEEESDD